MHVETVVMLFHKKPDSVINVKVELGEGEDKVPPDNIAKRAAAYKPKERVTHKMIQEYIEAKYGFKVKSIWCFVVKGLRERYSYCKNIAHIFAILWGYDLIWHSCGNSMLSEP